MGQTNDYKLSDTELAELGTWNTPTIFNGWEQLTKLDAGKDGFNAEECRDFMPEMGAMIGYAVMVVIEPNNAGHPRKNPKAWSEYRRYVASMPGPLIHADKHGFLVIPKEDQGHLLEAALFMDANERRTMIAAAKETRGKPAEEALGAIDKACAEFSKNTHARFAKKGEW